MANWFCVDSDARRPPCTKGIPFIVQLRERVCVLHKVALEDANVC